MRVFDLLLCESCVKLDAASAGPGGWRSRKPRESGGAVDGRMSRVEGHDLSQAALNKFKMFGGDGGF